VAARRPAEAVSLEFAGIAAIGTTNPDGVTYRELQAVGKPPIVVTDDTGMTLRAQASGLRVVAMSEDYLRRKPKSEMEDS
jgi:hypothetical protein